MSTGQPVPPFVTPVILNPNEWQARQTAHRRRVETLLAPHRERRGQGRKHPVFDFLFQYYSFRPGLLLRWSPGADAILAGEQAASLLEYPHFEERPEGVCLGSFPISRRAALEWTAGLLESTVARPPSFGCYGLHEWAMVYRSTIKRHEAVPLRLSHAEVARVVESQPVVCTHFDAFRFFTADARPLNRWQLTRERQPDFDQPGCIHANMDLYKHAYKLYPFIASELLADVFELAIAAREVDMRASPYDLTGLGYQPIPIETSEGRSEYAACQRGIADRAEPLRKQLLCACRALL